MAAEEVRDIQAVATAEAPGPGAENSCKVVRPRMGDVMVSRGLVTRAQLDECLTLQKSSPGERLGQIFVRKGYAKEDDAMACMAEAIGRRLKLMVNR